MATSDDLTVTLIRLGVPALTPVNLAASTVRVRIGLVLAFNEAVSKAETGHSRTQRTMPHHSRLGALAASIASSRENAAARVGL